MHAAVKIGLGLGAAAVLGWWAVRRAPAGAVAEPPIEPPSVALAPADGGATHRDAGSVPDESARAVIDAGAAPPASDAAPTSSDALDVHVIDARTREPLPQYAVALRAGETEEIVTTDANGVARIPRRWLDATFDLVALDDAEQRIPTRQERTIAPHELAAPSSPIVFEVLAGPTYRLLFVDPPPASGRLHVGLSIGTEPDRIRTHGRVREGSPPWTRLDPASASAAWLGEGPWTLSVRDVRGLWLASGPVHQIEGVQVEPVVLEGGARGALAVHATIDGAPIDHEITLGAYPFRDGRPHDDGKTPHVILGPPDRGFGHGRPGHATLDHLEPGRYMVWLASPSVRHHEEVEIRGGETTRIDVDLTRASDVAPLTVFLRSQTGRTSLSGLLVYGRHVGRPELDDIAHEVRQHADGTSEYRFDALAAGQWRIRVLYAGHVPPLERNDVLATAGGPAVELVCLDEGAPPRVRRRARVIDAFSRDAIPFAGVTTYVEGTRHFAQTAAADGTVELGPYTSDAHVVACVRAGDHRARFVEIDFDGDPEAVTDIALEPGWGTLIDVVEPSLEPGGKPLRGVRVTIDGLLAGTTDERGQLLVACDRRPAKIELALEGYRLSHGDVDSTTHAPAEHLFPFFVVMSRAP